MTRPLADVVTRDRFDLNDGPQREYRAGWNDAMTHVARECLPAIAAPPPHSDAGAPATSEIVATSSRVLAGLRELRDATPIVRPHDWPGVAELFDLGGEA